jgi:hypothetical protein
MLASTKKLLFLNGNAQYIETHYPWIKQSQSRKKKKTNMLGSIPDSTLEHAADPGYRTIESVQ